MGNSYNADTYQYWNKQISQVDKYRDKFITRGEKIVARYRDEDRNSDYESRYNILYSNTETLQPVIYAEKPTPEVRARDSKVISARKAGEMIERAIGYYLDVNDFNGVARLATTDFLLPGIGLMRPKYKPIMEIVEEEILIVEKEGKFYIKSEKVVFEEIVFEYVYWKDILFNDCTTWEDVSWIAFCTYMTEKEATEAFGAKKAKLLKYDTVKVDAKDLNELEAAQYTEKKAKVYEIWDKTNRDQLFFSETIDYALLEINEDPLGLEGFFPIPKPMFSITTSGTVLPVPFFKMYQDQAIELDDINSRISHMIDNMRRRGFYDASIGELANISAMGDNQFWPVKEWGEFAGKGGLNGAMQTEDITSYANILVILSEKRKQLLDDIYQIIGISDIRRGQTDPRETLGAQQMKGRYGTIRISTYQRKVAEFMRDLLKITGEIIINQFEPETIATITNMPLETRVERDEQGNAIKADVGVIDLLTSLREKSPSDITIDIQTDSTILEDDDADKSDLVDITAALSQFVQIAPAMGQVIGIDATANLLTSMVQKFKLGRNIHQEVQDHIDMLKKQAEEAKKNPQQTPPTKEEVELKKAQMQFETAQMEMQMRAQIDTANIAIKQQANFLKAQELQVYDKIESQKVDIKALEGFIKAEGLKIEKRNPTNEVVGV